MQGKNFDIFISYRRSDGSDKARAITETLKGKNYRCFLDFDKLKGGKFDERIEKAIKDAPVFIAVMTPDYLVRPKEDEEKELSEEEKEKQGEDWVYKEIEIANANNKYIISIDYNGKIKSIPKEVPASISKALGAHTFAEVHDGQTYASNMEDLIKGWISEIVPPPTEKTQGKANIEVSSDADCDILKTGEVIATIAKGGYNILKLSQGRHRLVCRSNDFSDIQQKVILEVSKDLAEDFIDVKLADKIRQRRIEIEAEKEERDRAEREKQIAEAVRRLVQNPTAQPKSLMGHSSVVFSVCWSPDGKYLASGSYDETVVIWDAESGQRLKTLKGHSDTVESVCWSPDGKHLVSGSLDGTLIIWDAKSGEKLKALEGHSFPVTSVSWSPDGKYLASGSSDRTIIIWNTNNGEKLKTLKGHFGSVISIATSPDGKYLASGSVDETVIIWDAKSGKILKTLEGHSWVVNSVSWNPDGKYLASGSEDYTIIIWDVNSGEKLKTLEGHSSSVESVSWSPDGKYLASGSRYWDGYIDIGEIFIWDAKSGKKLQTLEGHYSIVNSVCWSLDGKYLASGVGDGTVKIWGAD